MLNEVRVMGYLGADPEVRTTPNGSTSATFRLACSERWTDGNGQRQEPSEPARRQARAAQPSAQTSMSQRGDDPDDLPF